MFIFCSHFSVSTSPCVCYRLYSCWSAIVISSTYPVILCFPSSSLADHPSLQMTSTQRHQRDVERNRRKTMRKRAGGPLAMVLRFLLYHWLRDCGGGWQKEWHSAVSWLEKLFGTNDCTRTLTLAQIQPCWQENSLLPGRRFHLLLPLGLCSCTIEYTHTHTHTHTDTQASIYPLTDWPTGEWFVIVCTCAFCFFRGSVDARNTVRLCVVCVCVGCHTTDSHRCWTLSPVRSPQEACAQRLPLCCDRVWNGVNHLISWQKCRVVWEREEQKKKKRRGQISFLITQSPGSE